MGRRRRAGLTPSEGVWKRSFRGAAEAAGEDGVEGAGYKGCQVLRRFVFFTTSKVI